MKIRKIMAGITAGVMGVTCLAGCASKEVNKENNGAAKEGVVLKSEDVMQAVEDFNTGSYAVDFNFSEATIGSVAIGVDGSLDANQNAEMTITFDYDLKDETTASSLSSMGLPKALAGATLVEAKMVGDKIYVSIPKVVDLINKLGLADSMGIDISAAVGDAQWIELTKDEMLETVGSSTIGTVASEEDVKKIEEDASEAKEKLLPIIEKLMQDVFGDVAKDIVKADSKAISIGVTKDNLTTVIDALLTGLDNGVVDKALTELSTKCKELDLSDSEKEQIDEFINSYTDGGKDELINNLKKIKGAIAYVQKVDMTAKATLDGSKVGFTMDGGLVVDKKDMPDAEITEGENTKVDVTVGMNVELESKDVVITAPTEKTVTSEELQEAINKQMSSMYDYDINLDGYDTDVIGDIE